MPSLFLLWNSYKEPRLELGVELPIREAFLQKFTSVL